MPPCHCNTHSCGGAVRARNTVAIHREDDRKMRGRQALTAYQQVLDQEEEAISAYISTITLSEPNAAEFSSNKVWAPPAQVMIDNHRKSSLTPVDDVLRELDIIESDLDRLRALTTSKMESLAMPTSRTDAFPLLVTEDAVKNLQNRLYGLSVPHTRTLHARKEGIAGRLSAMNKELYAAKATWHHYLKQIPKKEEERSQAPVYDTGRCSYVH